MNKQVVTLAKLVAIIYVIGVVFEWIKEDNRHKEVMAGKEVEKEKVKSERLIKVENRKVASHWGASIINAASKIPAFIGLSS